jgi:hypothetical protein
MPKDGSVLGVNLINLSLSRDLLEKISRLTLDSSTKIQGNAQ